MPEDPRDNAHIATEDGNRWLLRGDWTLAHYASLKRTVRAARARLSADDDIRLDELGRLDTSGAALLASLLGEKRLAAIDTSALPPEKRALLMLVANALPSSRPKPQPQPPRIAAFLAGIGEKVEALCRQQVLLLGFVGLTLQVLALNLFRPRRWRVTSFVAHIEQTGLNAVPIVALLTFLVGAVIALLGATVLDDFGARIFTVNLVAFSFIREFGVLLAAILLAGRTASAFAAQIGSMKANEEIDAIRVLGLDAIELLVLPRVLAMMVSLPVLAFVGMVSGLVGGLAVCVLTLDISPLLFFTILERDTPLRHFLVGIGKAPLFAFIIALIGCLEGFKSAGSAESVGEHTTSSVVQSIFIVILLDALAALFFMEMGW